LNYTRLSLIQNAFFRRTKILTVSLTQTVRIYKSLIFSSPRWR